ncbi:MAG: hypothetical protein U0K57_08435 [Lachnospiraceae bacterium]|nr:hypothetical protein [Lachnospiraceae bacterium]
MRRVNTDCVLHFLAKHASEVLVELKLIDLACSMNRQWLFSML